MDDDLCFSPSPASTEMSSNIPFRKALLIPVRTVSALFFPPAGYPEGKGVLPYREMRVRESPLRYQTQRSNQKTKQIVTEQNKNRAERRKISSSNSPQPDLYSVTVHLNSNLNFISPPRLPLSSLTPMSETFFSSRYSSLMICSSVEPIGFE